MDPKVFHKLVDSVPVFIIMCNENSCIKLEKNPKQEHFHQWYFGPQCIFEKGKNCDAVFKIYTDNRIVSQVVPQWCHSSVVGVSGFK